MILTIGERLTKHQEIHKLLSSSDYPVIQAVTIPELDAHLSSNDSFAVALVDLKDAGISGYEAMRILRQKSPETQVVVVAQKHSTKEALEAQNRGAFCYFSEPLDVEEFLFLIAKAQVIFELALQNRDLKASFSGTSEIKFIGHGTEAQRILKQVQRVAGVNTTLLLTGASGTGKTTLARYIHSRSNRRIQPFISVSCAAIPRDLLEAELFGYEKGAFTGAAARKIGSIELADKGTLFLDELGDLPLELQPKLLTFLQDRQLRRLGGTKDTQLDVRIIAATNRDLEKMVQAKTFREDLFFRMNVVNIRLPSLSERRDDILSLAENFLARLAQVRSEEKCSLSQEACQKLLSYSWPGNVRELENVLERASLFCTDFRIVADDLGLSEEGVAESLPSQFANEMSLADLEKRVIEERIKRFAGNKQQAAHSLGISLKTIYNKIRLFGIA